MDSTEYQQVEHLLGYSFENRELLDRALTHASKADHRLDSNERLEFLGDAVLGMVVCEYLFEHFQDLLEGELTKIKSTVVSRQTCAEVALDMGLGELLRLGKGMSNHDELPNSVVAAVYESIIGAIFVDGGLEVTRQFILGKLRGRIDKAARSGHQYNFKSVLQQSTQQLEMEPPQYVVLDEKGPDHAKCFEVCVEVGARRFDSCWGPSKKHAEQQAALEALISLGVAERNDEGDVMLLDSGDTVNPFVDQSTD